MKNSIYMQYICKNCGCIYLDKDVKGRMTPIKGCYCPDCQNLGFKNPSKRPKKKLSNKQKEILNKNKFPARKKVNLSEENLNLDKRGDRNDN